MKLPTTFPLRFRNPASPKNIIQIQNGTFYRQHPNGTGSGTLQDLDPPLFPNLDFSLSAFPRRRDAGNWKEQQHWAIVGAGGTTTFLEVLRGTHICLPPNARAFPYLSSKDIEAKDDRQRSPFHAIQYVGFTPSKAQGLGAGTRGSYLSARYESRREETDWSVIQYLKGQTQLNPPEKLLGRYTCFDKLLSQVIHDLKLERLTSMPVSNLSNGQARRARIAKALLGRPEVLLLDGPFMGLDPPTLISLSPMLRELAYKSSPRLIMSLRPQDPIPDWITHLAILGRDYTLALAGIKEEVLFAVHRWVNAYNSHRSGIAEKMAALMTEKYGPPPTDVGNTLSTNGVFPYDTYSKIMSSTDPSYIQPTGEVIPEHLSRTNETIWRKAAGKRREKADLDDLLALTCLLPADFSPGEDTRTSLAKVANIDQAPTDKTLKHENEMPLESTNMDPLIELKNVVVSYGSRTVLGQGIQSGFSTGGINFTVRQGTRLALLGPNGSGKTTFLSLLTSDHPQSYSLPIRYFGRSRLASQGKPGLSLWEIQTRIGHSSPEIHTFFPTGLTIRRSLESAWADTFSAKPKLTNVAKRLVDAFLRWWEPELNPCYSPPPLFTSCNAPIDDWIAKSYPPFKYPAKVDDPLAWACSTSNTFGTLPFQSQRLLLFLRAVIKNPDVVILDEAFSGFSPEARDKAMLFLRAGERLVLHRPLIPAHGRLEVNEEDRAQQRSPSENTRNKRVDVEKICREMNITVDDLLGEEKLTTETGRIVHELRRLTHDQLVDMADSNNPPSDYAFTGLSSQQALIVVSHVREEIPDVVNEYMRLPGEEEVSEQGKTIEMGKCEDGSIRTLEGWGRIWGVRT